MKRFLERLFPSQHKLRELHERLEQLEARASASEQQLTDIRQEILSVSSGSDSHVHAVARGAVDAMLARTTGQGSPNVNALWLRLNDIDLLRLNVKNLGYEMARRLAADLPAVGRYTPIGLSCRPARQAEVHSEWFIHWCSELRLAPLHHRKLWEYAFVLQSLAELDLLRPNVRALGFGCGQEPLPSYFAGKGIEVTVTDLLPEEVAGQGWAETAQHTGTLRHAWKSEFIEWEQFERLAHLEYVDMNDIPPHLKGYDFCWSICSLEHLGSIDNGLKFVKNSLNTLRPGGYALHTTEFNYLDDAETVDHWPTVLFQRQHFETLAMQLRGQGHRVFPLDFDKGTGFLDRFVDLPPYWHQGIAAGQWAHLGQAAHINLSIDGFASTCFGLLIQKGF